MRALIEPRQDSAYWLSMTGDPTYSYNIFGGCMTASLPCSLTPRQRNGLLLARVSLYGTEGLVWQGFAWDKPNAEDTALTAVGHNATLGMTTVTVDYGDDRNGTSVLLSMMEVRYDSAWAFTADAAHLAWILEDSSPALALPSITGTLNDIVTEVLKYAAFAWGWYPEWVSGRKTVVPHYEAISTTPDYVLAIRTAEQNLEGGSADPLVSIVNVTYNAGASTTTRTDTNAAHPLVALGVNKHATLDVATATLSVAQTAGDRYLAENGRAQVRGTVPLQVIRSVNGATVAPNQVRPGRMVRLLTSDGVKDAIVQEVECTGERFATITLDSDPNRVDRYLARLEARTR